MLNSGKLTSLGACILALSFCAACGASAPPAPAPVASPADAPQMQRALATAAPSSLEPSPAVPLQVSPVPTEGTSASAGQAAARQGQPMMIRQVFDIPDGILDALDTLLEECVGAFFEASIQNGGQPTTTGTLRRLADGTFAYSAAESDDLLLTAGGGETIRMTFSEVEGDLNADARQLLRGDHRVGCTIDVPNALAVELSASKADLNETRSIRGTIQQDGVVYKVDLRSDGTRTWDPDVPAQHVVQQRRGSVAFGDAAITVDEDFDYKLVNTAQQIRHRIGSAWNEGSRHYRLQDGYYQFTLKEGRLEEPDYWRAQGTLIQDDQAIGQLEMRVSGASGSLVLTLGDGQTVLKSWD